MINMNEKENILTDNFNEYFSLGLRAFKEGKYNSATTLFFKAIASLCDIYLLKKEGRIPSSHSDRFRVLEDKYPQVYAIVDKDFPFYQESYTKKMDKESAELLKNDIETLKKILNA